MMAERNGVSRVIVLQGGDSPEASVSRSSAAGVVAALARLGVAHDLWELDGDWVSRLAALQGEPGIVVFCNALHGGMGENGVVQGVCEALGLRYTGSSLPACALAMDKVRARHVLAAVGVHVAEGGEVFSAEEIEDWILRLGKVVVKPVDGGSSLGVSILEKGADVAKAFHAAAKAGSGRVMVEDFIAGVELTTGVLGTQVLPVIEIVPSHAMYDFESKYTVGGSEHIIPARVPHDVTAHVQHMALLAGRALGCTGAYRVDFRYDERLDFLGVLEVNTLPGFTPTSLLPDAAGKVGMTYDELVMWIIKAAL
ncbi:MAG: D-alanine--D-alanine ligase [Alphaproteobacteria bacterium CG_4_10_14_0_8_um_filter_53_9]|nr:MAG: D-alanine--D-alanine ligase [Alphaproteobacteria bacterium CG_4_10_14_0_8_um_filter_53_9]